MNILLWIIQVLLALHTVMGALWKFSNPSQTVGSLAVIPHQAWIGMSVVEILCAVCLILPVVNKALGISAPIAAIIIAVEMLAVCAVHFSSGAPFNGQVIYWLVVAAVCAFVALGRLLLRPI